MKKTFYLFIFSFLLASGIANGQRTIAVPVNAPSDDLEEYIPGAMQTQTLGNMDAGSSDLELGAEDGNNIDPQLVGIRFTNLDIPKGSLILSAYIVFTVDATNKNTDPCDIVIRLEDNSMASTFDVNTPFNISSRTTLGDSVVWNIPAGSWANVGEAGKDQTTPDLASLIQQLINKSDWASGGSMVFTLAGTGTREAEAYDGSPDSAPRLVIQFVDPVITSIRISAPEDDLEEFIAGPTQTKPVGNLDAGSSDLELGTEAGNGNDPQLIGMRFQNIPVPKGSVIRSAKIQFTVDEMKSQAAANYVIKAQAGIDPLPFDANTPFNISARPVFPDSVSWSVSENNWLSAGEAGPDQLTPDLTSLLQAVIDQDGWVAGQSAVFTLYGTGCKVAESYDGSPDQAPQLVIEYFSAATAKLRVSTPEDDLEEFIAGPTQTKPVGSLDAGSSDLELGTEAGNGNDPQLIGLRFQNLGITAGTPIQSAFLQFTVDELKNAGAATMIIKAQANPLPASFDATTSFNISSRAVFNDSIIWNIPADSWLNAGEAGVDQRSPDIASLINAVINQPGWEAGNPLVLTLYGSGCKVAESYDGSPDQAAELIVNYLSSKKGLDPTPYPLAAESTWSYQDIAAPESNWTEESYDDSTWPFGKGVLGYGDPAVNVEVANSVDTVYFRKKIIVEDLTALTPALALQLKADDAAQVFINGVEVLNFNDPIAESVESYRERVYFLYEIPSASLVEGINTIAVRLITNDDDLLFDLTLTNFNARDNTPDYNCASPDDAQISCFSSIIPTPQDDFIRIPENHEMQYIVRKGEPYTDGSGVHGDDFDFTGYVPINGSSRHGYLSINYEDDPGGVGIVEVKLNVETGLWEKLSSTGVDFSSLGGTLNNCSGGVTPWGTSITCEEDIAGEVDANGDGYFDFGWCVEIDPATATVKDYGTGTPQKLWALGRMEHENVVVHSDLKTVYYAEDASDGSVYKFIATNPGDLTTGDVYVLKLDQPLANAEPTGTTGQWIKVPNSTIAERNNLKSTALNTLGASAFPGNEDVDISPLDGKIYFAVKGSGRVYRFTDNGTTFSEFETFVGGTEYVIHTEYGRILEPWGQGNDNLTFDDRGNLYVLQDGTRNFIWLVGPDHTQENPQVNVFLGSPSGSEPTGMTFTPDFRYMFLSIQSPNGVLPQADVTGNSVVHDNDVAFVIANSAYLNEPQSGSKFAPPMVRGLDGWEASNVYTVGETIDGYTPPGILDGIGAIKKDDGDVRVFVNHEMGAAVGYPYTLANGLSITGARVSYFDIDSATLEVKDAGLAYHTVYDRVGNVVTAASQINEGASATDGFGRFCSAALFEAGQYGLVDDIFFTGEEDSEGIEYALDIANETLYALPWLGRASWENVTLLDAGPDQIALLGGDDREGAPLLLYVGNKTSGDFLQRNGLADGKLYAYVLDGYTSPQDFNGTGSNGAGHFEQIAHYDLASAGTNGYDALGFATQAKQDQLYAEAGAFKFSRPEDLATNPANGLEVVFASTGRGQTFPADNWGTVYILDFNLTNLTADIQIAYSGDDAGGGQVPGSDYGLRSPDNLDWADDGFIYIQEDRSTSPASLFGGTSGEEASIWSLNPSTYEISRIAQVDRSATPPDQSDASPADIGNWETSGIIDVTSLFKAEPGVSLFLMDAQAHSVKDGVISAAGLAEGGQLLFLKGNTNLLFPSPMVKGLDEWEANDIFTVGQTINGYTPAGLFDGIGALKKENGDVRLFVNHELGAGVGYPYTLESGLSLKGARISFFDVDATTLEVKDAGMAYHTIYDRAGNEARNATQINEGTSQTDGIGRFCSASLFEKGTYGLEDDIYFAGEEEDGGIQYALDVQNETLYALPWLGRAAWENVTLIDADAEKVAILIGDDREAAPLLLYVGNKTNGNFLERNGLADGKLYVYTIPGYTSPEDFKGTHSVASGLFVEIEHYNAGSAGTNGYDALGFATQTKQNELAAAAGAFKFSRPEDISTNPQKGNEIVFASTGRGQTFPSDNWGTVYVLNLDYDNLTAKIRIAYSGDDAGGGQFEGPDFGLRSPDNLDWADDGYVYIQEDKSTNPGSTFGGTSGEEASIWRLHPYNSKLERVAQVDRSSVPNGQTDVSPTEIGNWETSGILDVSKLFNMEEGNSLFIIDAQAHSLKDGIISSAQLGEGGQLLFLKGKTENLYSAPMITGLDGWRTWDIFTIGQTIDGYTPAGITDGIGAIKKDDGDVRVFVNHELGAAVGYPYMLANGLSLTGARVSYFDVDAATLEVKDAGLAYHTVYDRAGNIVTSASQINEGASATDGFGRFCSASLFRNGQYGLVDDIYFTGEEGRRRY